MEIDFSTSTNFRKLIFINGTLKFSTTSLSQLRYWHVDATLFKSYSPRVARDMNIYYALVEDLRYDICFWGSCGETLFQTLFVLQKRVVNFMHGSNQVQSCRPFFLLYKILTLTSFFILETAINLIIQTGIRKISRTNRRYFQVKHVIYIVEQP